MGFTFCFIYKRVLGFQQTKTIHIPNKKNYEKGFFQDKTFVFRVCYDIQNVLGLAFVPFLPIQPFATT